MTPGQFRMLWLSTPATDLEQALSPACYAWWIAQFAQFAPLGAYGTVAEAFNANCPLATEFVTYQLRLRLQS